MERRSGIVRHLHPSESHGRGGRTPSSVESMHLSPTRIFSFERPEGEASMVAAPATRSFCSRTTAVRTLASQATASPRPRRNSQRVENQLPKEGRRNSRKRGEATPEREEKKLPKGWVQRGESGGFWEVDRALRHFDARRRKSCTRLYAGKGEKKRRQGRQKR